jgi:hypothetical protein
LPPKSQREFYRVAIFDALYSDQEKFRSGNPPCKILATALELPIFMECSKIFVGHVNEEWWKSSLTVRLFCEEDCHKIFRERRWDVGNKFLGLNFILKSPPPPDIYIFFYIFLHSLVWKERRDKRAKLCQGLYSSRKTYKKVGVGLEYDHLNNSCVISVCHLALTASYVVTI